MENTDYITKVSKFLSLVLRHKPETIGLKLDANGWTSVEELLRKLEQHNKKITMDQLKEVVANNNKKRFAFSEDYSKIRASQGHSVEVDLQLKEEKPPVVLYHGTVEKNIPSIKQKGILKGQRHHVHLSKDVETAVNVGKRHGLPLILSIQSERMFNDGFKFYISANGVWLSDEIPAEYISFPA